MAGRTRDTPSLVLPVLLATLMIAQQVASKAVRDSLFLSQFPVGELPKVMVAAAIVSIPTVLLTSVSMVRFGPGWVARGSFALSGALFAVEWACLPRFPNAVAVLVYLHVTALGSTVISTFWSVINERFDPHTARKAMSQITTGSAVGGLLGGLLVSGASPSVETRVFLLALALASTCCALCMLGVGSRTTPTTRSQTTSFGLTALFDSAYLRMIAGTVLLMGLLSAMVDFAFKAHAARSLADGSALMSFFAAFYTVTSFATAVLQAAFARKSLSRLGIAGTLAILPAAVLLAGSLSVAVLRLWSVTLLRGAATVVENSFFRSGYEPLYTPVPSDQKRSTKAIIDVAMSRLGDALGGALILAMTFFLREAPITPAVGIAMAGAAVGLWLTMRLHRAYVQQLQRALRSGALTMSESDAVDSTTRLAISQTQIELDRAQLLAQLASLRAPPIAEAPEAAELSRVSVVPAESSEDDQMPDEALQLAAAVKDLLSGDVRRARRRLAEPFDPRLTPFAIPLLATSVLSLRATAALKSVSSQVAGQLIDALLDPAQSVVVRRRLPRVLATFADARSVRGLIQAMHDPALEVRKRVALSLSALAQKDPELAPPKHVMFDAVERELDAAEGSLDLQHVFVMLSMTLDPEAAELARRALASRDIQQRGTALEYLETVLPGPLRTRLWPYLQDPRGQPSGITRGHQELLEELRRHRDRRARRRARLGAQ